MTLYPNMAAYDAVRSWVRLDIDYTLLYAGPLAVTTNQALPIFLITDRVENGLRANMACFDVAGIRWFHPGDL